MQIFSKIRRSIYDPKYYLELNDQSLSYSFRYVLKFGLMLGLLFVVKFAIFTLPAITSGISEIGPAITNGYPAELEVVVQDGKVSKNIEGPYVIKNPDQIQKMLQETQETMPANLIVIDTGISPDVSYLKTYDTSVLVTQTHIIYEDSNGKITVQSLEKVPNTTINKNSVNTWVTKYSPYLYWIIPLAFVGVFLFAFSYVGFNLIYLLFAALLIMLVAKFKKVPLSYKKSYQYSIHLMTLPVLIIWLVPTSFACMFTLLLLGMAFLNIKKVQTEDTVSPESIEPLKEVEEVHS